MSWYNGFLKECRGFEEALKQIKEINKIQSPKPITVITEMQINGVETAVRHLGNGSYEILEPKTNNMRIKKKDLNDRINNLDMSISIKERNIDRQIDYLVKELTDLKKSNSNLRDRLDELENPPKYKIGEIIGKYTIIEASGLMCNSKLGITENTYTAIKDDKIVEVYESKLDKIFNKLNKKP